MIIPAKQVPVMAERLHMVFWEPEEKVFDAMLFEGFMMYWALQSQLLAPPLHLLQLVSEDEQVLIQS